jgi:DNA-directed RNA polymerase I subunit RPA2
MKIACLDEDVGPGTTHQEIYPTNILSVVASLTPFSDFNQSPRNMYQCQVKIYFCCVLLLVLLL